MADDLAKTLESLAGQSTVLEQLAKGLDKVTEAKKKALAAGDITAIVAYAKMEKAINKLRITTEQYTQAQEDAKKAAAENKELTEEQIENLKKITKEYSKAESEVKSMAKSAVDSHNAMGESMAKTQAKAVEYWKANDALGVSFSFVTKALTSTAAKFTAAGLAMNAMRRHVQATELQQNILIQSYKGLDVAVAGTDGTIGKLAGKLGSTGKAIYDVGIGAAQFSDAIAKADATANRMGVSTEYVADSMQKFSRITGSTTPEVLGKLTEGAITVSRAMGITVPEAVDFVATRMDKFGGSAASAIVSLNTIRTDAEKVNKEFKRTVVRADDVVRTLSDISRQTNMYAIDQRFVGNILRENISRLQSTGDSYESANKKAQAFSKAVTGGAPEWMQVYAGQDVLGKLMKGFNPKGEVGEKIEESLRKELNAAKPGLADEMEKILGDKNMGYYSKLRLVQEMTSGTTLGITAMNKQILKLAQNPQGVELIAEQFHVSRVEAQGMIDQSKQMEKDQAQLARLTKARTAEELLSVAAKDKSLRIDAKQAKYIFENLKTDKERVEYLEQMKRGQSQEDVAQRDAARLTTERKRNLQAQKEINEKIKDYERLKGEALVRGDAEAAKSFDQMIKDKNAELSRYDSKDQEQGEGLKTVEDINRAILKKFEGYSVNTGNEIKAIISQLSTTSNLILGAIGLGVLKLATAYFKPLAKIEGYLAKISTGGGMGAAGAASDREMPELPEGKDKEGGKKDGKKETKDLTKEEKKKAKAAAKAEKAAGKKPGFFQRTRERFSRKGGSVSPKKSMFSRAGSKLAAGGSKVGRYLTTFNSMTDAAGSFTGKMATFGKLTQGASLAVSLAGNLFGDSLETSGKDMEKFGKSGVGKMANFTQALSMMPGPIGALASAFNVGVEAGHILNKGLDMLGLTTDKVGQGMADLVTTGGPLQKVYEFFGQGNANAGGKEYTQRVSSMAGKYGMTQEQMDEIIDKKPKENTLPLAKYLESIGKKRIDTPASAPTKEVVKTQIIKETKSAQAPILSQTGTSLKGPNASAVPVDTKAGANAATDNQAAQADQDQTQQAQTPTTASNDAMPASFVGGFDGVGSIMLKVDNCIPVLAKALAHMKQRKIGQASG